jgi:hypothetical protein
MLVNGVLVAAIGLDHKPVRDSVTVSGVSLGRAAARR